VAHGRRPSLDFFVSLTLMPISVAVAGFVGEAIGLAPAFLAAGAIPVVLAVATILVFRLRTEIDCTNEFPDVRHASEARPFRATFPALTTVDFTFPCFGIQRIR
jgi:hypothetical protein